MHHHPHDHHSSPSHGCFRALREAGKHTRLAVSHLLEEDDITRSQFRLLRRVSIEGVPLTQLAITSWIDPGNVTGIVDRLVRQGYVTRDRSDKDRRVVLVKLTDKGSSLVKKVRPKFHRMVDDVMSVLSADEIETLTHLLRKVSRRDETTGEKLEKGETA